MYFFGSVSSSASTPASNGSSLNGLSVGSFSEAPKPALGAGSWGCGAGAGAGAGAGLATLSVYFSSLTSLFFLRR